MQTQDLIQRLMELPALITKKQTEMLNLSIEFQESTDRIAAYETQLKARIATMTDDSGKKLYSNEDARRAAFAEMTEDDLELIELKDSSKSTERRLQESRIEFDALNNEQKNIRTILALVAAQGEVAL